MEYIIAKGKIKSACHYTDETQDTTAKINPPPKPLTEVVEAVANRHQEAGYLPSTNDNLPSSFENASREIGESSRFFLALDDAIVQAWCGRRC